MGRPKVTKKYCSLEMFFQIAFLLRYSHLISPPVFYGFIFYAINPEFSNPFPHTKYKKGCFVEIFYVCNFWISAMKFRSIDGQGTWFFYEITIREELGGCMMLTCAYTICRELVLFSCWPDWSMVKWRSPDSFASHKSDCFIALNALILYLIDLFVCLLSHIFRKQFSRHTIGAFYITFALLICFCLILCSFCLKEQSIRYCISVLDSLEYIFFIFHNYHEN